MRTHEKTRVFQFTEHLVMNANINNSVYMAFG